MSERDGLDRGIPIIRLTLEGMRASILMALTEYEGVLASETKKAVEAYCTPENLQAVVNREAAAVIDHAVREELDRFFRRGDGREIIRQLVEERIASNRW